MAKLAQDWFAVPPGEVHPRWMLAGEECPAELEAEARAAGKLGAPVARRKAKE